MVTPLVEANAVIDNCQIQPKNNTSMRIGHEENRRKQVAALDLSVATDEEKKAPI